MATILTKEQVNRIKPLRAKINKLQPEGWMCEGADKNLNQFFNNQTGAFFLADYNGNISCKEGQIPVAMVEVARLEGEICKITEENNDSGNSV